MDNKRQTVWGGTGAPSQVLRLDDELDTTESRKSTGMRGFLLGSLTTSSESPLKEHSVVMESEQSGRILVLRQNSQPDKLLALRRMDQCQKGEIKGLRGSTSAHLVSCRQIHCWNDKVYLIEELLKYSVSLPALLQCPRSRLGEAEVGTISESILRAISAVHTDLKVPHGRIEQDNILITSDGKVKLGKSDGDSGLECTNKCPANWMESQVGMRDKDLGIDLQCYAEVVEALIRVADMSEGQATKFRDITAMARSGKSSAADILKVFKGADWNYGQKSNLHELAFVSNTIDFPAVTVFPASKDKSFKIETYF